MRRLLAPVILALVGLAVGWALRERVLGLQLDLSSGLLLLAAAWLALAALAELGLWGLGASSERRSGVRVLVVTLGSLAFASELFLRFGDGRYTSYLESQGSPTYVGARRGAPSWFHLWRPNEPVRIDNPYYSHLRHANSLGLCEVEIPIEKAPDEYRVIALGDSFTEGMGTAYETTWVKVVEQELARRLPNRTVTTMNAGVSGSDPFYGYVLLEQKLLAYAPDLVIVPINQSDLEDVVIRGGLERFLPDGSYRSVHQPPAWEWLYGISYLTRHFAHDVLGYDRIFIRRGRIEAERLRAAEEIGSLVPRFVALGAEHGFRVAVVVHASDENALVNRAYPPGIEAVVSILRESEGDFDLIDVLAWCTEHDVMVGEEARRYFWAGEGHHTTEGYAVLGRAIAAGLQPAEALPGSGPAARSE